MNCLRDLLVHAIDYAGLFPPAALDMASSVRNYASYRKGPERWALGRFVLPVARLGEFEKAASPLLQAGEPWPLSVLGGSDLEADLGAIEAFRGRHLRDARVASLEIKVDDVRKAAATIAGRIETFYEIPIAKDPRELLDAIHDVRGRAKIRTGGTTKGVAPSPAELARFLDVAQCRSAFKATAGLHHAVRSLRPLTYEAGCDSDVLHGFLNVFIASCFALRGTGAGFLQKILDDQDPRHLRLDPPGFMEHDLKQTELQYARSMFILSFGSCSFEEPIAELQELRLL
jgi:hypothetical protein